MATKAAFTRRIAVVRDVSRTPITLDRVRQWCDADGRVPVDDLTVKIVSFRAAGYAYDRGAFEGRTAADKADACDRNERYTASALSPTDDEIVEAIDETCKVWNWRTPR